MSKLGFTKENVDLNAIFDKAVEALEKYPEKDVVASLIVDVMDAGNIIYEKSALGPEDIEILSAYQQAMAELRDNASRSKWNRLTSLSIRKNPVDESRSDLEKMTELLTTRHELAEKLIERYASILEFLEKELERLLEGKQDPSHRRKLRELYKIVSN